MWRQQLEKAISELPELQKLEMILASVSSHRQHLISSITREAIESVEKLKTLSFVDRAKTIRGIIVTLNHNLQFEEVVGAANKLGQLLVSEEAEQIPAKERAYIFNELGNCLRYACSHEQALIMYDRSLDIIGRDPSNSNVRRGLQNIAIILREQNHFSKARAAFANLKPFARDAELRGLIVSEAICLEEMGLPAEASNLLEDNVSLVEGRHLDNPHILEYSTLQASLLLEMGKIDEAARFTAMLEDYGKRKGYLPATAAAAHIELVKAIHDRERQDSGVALESAIVKMSEIVDKFVDHDSLPTLALMEIRDLDRALNITGQYLFSNELIKKILASLNPEKTPKGWLLHYLMARNFLHLSKEENAFEHIEGGFRYLDRALWSVAANEDVISIYSSLAKDVMELAGLAFRPNCAATQQPGAMLRFAVDLRAAPVLSARLRRAVGLPPAGENIAEEDARLRSLLMETPAVVLQFAETVSDVSVVRTWLDGNGQLQTDYRFLGISPESLMKTAARLRLALRSSNPMAPNIAVCHVRGWNELTALLRACLEGVSEELPLYVVAGPIGEAAFQLALEDRTICFIPSLSSLLALRKRRRELNASGLDIRRSLKRWFDFAVWFDRERTEETGALSSIGKHGAEAAAAHGLSHDAAKGRDATAERLLEGLSAADIARIACHGRVLPHAEAIDLLVAADGYLPPADLSELRESDVHVFGWQRLTGLAKAPTVVISSACDSGLTLVNAGGERIGLERPLFTAGSLVYVAPLWPVPTVAMQKLVANVVDRWLGDDKGSLSDCVALTRPVATKGGLPPLATMALAVFGDGI